MLACDIKSTLEVKNEYNIYTEYQRKGYQNQFHIPLGLDASLALGTLDWRRNTPTTHPWGGGGREEKRKR
jgi:hypothetical protein